MYEGGANDIFNYVTACEDCNQGKGRRRLSDDSVLSKQSEELIKIAEKREQIEMMGQWKRVLISEKDTEIQEFERFVSVVFQEPASLSPHGKRQAKIWIKKYGLEAVFDTAITAFDKFPDNFEKAITYIPKILSVESGNLSEDQKRLFYIRGIARNRFPSINQKQCLALMMKALEAGWSALYIELLAKRVKTASELTVCLRNMQTGTDIFETGTRQLHNIDVLDGLYAMNCALRSVYDKEGDHGNYMNDIFKMMCCGISCDIIIEKSKETNDYKKFCENIFVLIFNRIDCGKITKEHVYKIVGIENNG